MATSNSRLKQGDVVVVPLPYADQFAEKRRPAVVISGNAFNTRTKLVWVAMITSAVNISWPDDVPLNLKNTGLNSPSVVRIAKLATIDPVRIIRVAGKIDAKALKLLRAKLQAIVE